MHEAVSTACGARFLRRSIRGASARRAALAAVLLAAAAAGAPARAYQAADFFPLAPGDSWTRNSNLGPELTTMTVLPGLVTVEGVATRVIEVVTGTSVTHFHHTVDAAGVRTHRISFPTIAASWTYDPPYVTLPATFGVGTQLLDQVSAIDVVGFAPGTPHVYENDLRVLRTESVTVPAGTFAAVVVESQFVSFGVAGTSTVWLVEGVGPVKTVTNGIVEELVASTLLPEPANGAPAAIGALAALSARRRRARR